MATKETKEFLPPQSFEAEKALLGSLICNNDNIVKILGRIKPEDFYKDTHREIFQAIFSLYETKVPVDFVTLSNELSKTGKLDFIGGQSFLTSLATELSTSANIMHYAEIIREKATQRALLNYSIEIQAEIEDGKKSVDVIAESSQYLSKLAQENIKEDFLEPKELALKYSEELNYRIDKGIIHQGISTSYYNLDNLIGGFREGDFVVIGAPQKMGKTALLLDFVNNICIKKNIPCLYLTMEMNEDEILTRLLAKMSQIGLENIRHATLKKEEYREVLLSLSKYRESKTYIHFSPGIDLFKLCAEIKRIKAKYDLKMVFVDYLQLISNVIKNRSRYEEIAGISRVLKNLAGELRITILTAAQLDANEDGRHRFNRIRECKSVEHDCDSLIHIDRPKWQDINSQDTSAEIIVVCSRHGRPGKVKLQFNENIVSFTEE